MDTWRIPDSAWRRSSPKFVECMDEQPSGDGSRIAGNGASSLNVRGSNTVWRRIQEATLTLYCRSSSHRLRVTTTLIAQLRWTDVVKTALRATSSPLNHQRLTGSTARFAQPPSTMNGATIWLTARVSPNGGYLGTVISEGQERLRYLSATAFAHSESHVRPDNHHQRPQRATTPNSNIADGLIPPPVTFPSVHPSLTRPVAGTGVMKGEVSGVNFAWHEPSHLAKRCCRRRADGETSKSFFAGIGRWASLVSVDTSRSRSSRTASE